MPNRRSVFWSRFLTPLIAGLVAAGGCLALYLREAGELEQRSRDAELTQLESFSKLIAGDLRGITRDLLTLADGVALHSFLTTGRAEDLNLAANRAVFFSRQQPGYEQLRYIDEHGREVLRVNQGGELVSPAQLQDKSDRSYFKKASALAQGQIFVSAFDLNIENGVVEQPLKPIVRFATPIFDATGRRRGIYIVNYLGASLVTHLREFAPQSHHRLRLLSPQGYWFTAADPAHEWGFALPDRAEHTLARTAPALWERISREPQGQAPHAGGLLTWSRVTPRRALASTFDVAVTEDPFWIVASEISPAELASITDGMQPAFLLAATVLFLALGAWFVSSSQSANGLPMETPAKKPRFPLERRIALGFVLALLVLVTTAIGIWRNAARYDAAFQSVGQTHRVLYYLERTLVAVLNIESGERGFILTGDADFRPPFEIGVAQAGESVRELRRLTAGNPAQQRRLDQLEPLLREQIALVGRLGAERRALGLAAVAGVVAQGEGKALVDRMRELIAEMSTEEQRLMNRLSAETRAAGRATLWIFTALALLATTLVALAALRVSHDLRRRRQAEEERDQFFELSRDLFGITDQEGHFLRLNAAWETMLGHPRSKLLGRRARELVHPDDLPILTTAFRRMTLNENIAAPAEFRLLHVNGDHKWVLGHIVWQPTQERIYFSGRDISDRKHTEELQRRFNEQLEARVQARTAEIEDANAALRDSERRFRTLTENLPYILSRYDPEFRLVYGNLAREAISVVPPEENIGRTADELGVSRTIKEGMARVAATRKTERLEAEHNGVAGLTLWESTIVPEAADDGSLSSILVVSRDITARRKTEERILELNATLEERVRDRTAQLETTNRELEAFSYSVSHDLRAPLRHIDGFSDLLRKNVGSSLDEKGRRYLAVISDAARQMGRLIDDLLSFSRISRAPLAIAPLDHDNLVAAVICDGHFESCQPSITWDIAPLPPVVVDAAMLRQVWANLIDNAVKYSGKVPHPRIEIGHRPPTAETRETVFFIRDNGAGFDMKYAGKLFGVFQRLHRVEDFPGTGVGLATVHRIVTRHGGRVWAESSLGQGATFYFTLPESPV